MPIEHTHFVNQTCNNLTDMAKLMFNLSTMAEKFLDFLSKFDFLSVHIVSLR